MANWLFSALRVERVNAENLVRFAETIAVQDPSWGTQTFPIADGVAVLFGRGLYVNSLFIAGVEASVTPDDLYEFEQRCGAMGLPASIEVTSTTSRDLVSLLSRRGYKADSSVDAFVVDLTSANITSIEAEPESARHKPSLQIERANGDLLGLWQETSATAWGHSSVAARRASDAFAAAAAIVDGPGLLLVRDAADKRPLACASTTMHDGVATLGGMSTLSNERRRGIQKALIEHRLGLARAAGCDLAYTTATTGGDSARNLARNGFEFLHTRTSHILKPRTPS